MQVNCNFSHSNVSFAKNKSYDIGFKYGQMDGLNGQGYPHLNPPNKRISSIDYQKGYDDGYKNGSNQRPKTTSDIINELVEYGYSRDDAAKTVAYIYGGW